MKHTVSYYIGYAVMGAGISGLFLAMAGADSLGIVKAFLDIAISVAITAAGLAIVARED